MKETNKNLKLFPKYRQISRDFLFFYTINFLFLTQIKNIEISSIVLLDTFYSLFLILFQVPATLIVEKIGRKKGMILGNICNVIYLILVINSKNFWNLICAEITSSLGFSLKDITEPAILNESIELKEEEKSKKFAKIQGKAISGYYALSAISMIISGFLFEINGYIPMFFSLIIVIIVLLMSTRFEEPKHAEINERNVKETSLKEAIIFAYKSKRCRCLLLFSAIFFAIFSVLGTYEISLLEELNIPSRYIGITFAFLNIISSVASGKQSSFQTEFKNRTLTILGVLLPITCIIAGYVASLNLSIYSIVFTILFMYVLKYVVVGLFNVLSIKYLSNFTNSQIDTKIFAINNFMISIFSAIFGIVASALVANFIVAKAMIIFGIIIFIIIIILLIYMKNKVGLNPSNYSDLELKYDVKNNT